MTKKFIHVEILCKTLFKTLCNFREPFCEFLYDDNKKCEQLYFTTKFFYLPHRVIHQSFTLVFSHAFSHLHIPYYNYYKK